MTDAWAEALRATGDENAFNPSIARLAGREHIAYRAYGPGRRKPFHAYLLTHGDAGWERTDLTSQAAEHGIDVVADPKLVVLGDALYVTFNTGYDEVSNDLYLMRVLPSAGAPQRCVLDGRQKVEKNWGFYLDDDGLATVYGLTPLVVLRLRRGVLGDGGDLELAPVMGAAPVTPIMSLTLGTQPLVRGDDLIVVAHEKVRLRGRRGYVGRPVTIAGVSRPAQARVVVGRTRLIHSAASLLGGRGERHNPNLWFATYFSGAVVDGPLARLSYGINDCGFGFAETRAARLWR